MWGHVAAGRRCTPWLGVVWAWHTALNAVQAHVLLACVAYMQVNKILLDDLLSTVDAHMGCDISLPPNVFWPTSVL